eukprot:652786-Pyramimonas_sp.AAC.2
MEALLEVLSPPRYAKQGAASHRHQRPREKLRELREAAAASTRRRVLRILRLCRAEVWKAVQQVIEGRPVRGP